MRITAQVLSQSDVNSKGLEVVVVDGVNPNFVFKYLPNHFIVVQHTEEDSADFFTTSDSVLNTLKPPTFICESPTDSDKELCKSFGCKILSLEDLARSEKSIELPVQQEVVQTVEEVLDHSLEFKVTNTAYLSSEALVTEGDLHDN